MSDLCNQICGISPRYKRFTGILIAIIVLLVAACVAQNDENKSSVDSRQDTAGHTDKDKVGPHLTTQRYPRYVLGANDVLDITFEFTPEFNQTVTVQPDGYITLRGAGDLHVAGRPVPEVTEAIRSAYGKVLQDPAIAVVLKDFEKPYVVVGGQVARPGKYDLRGDMTITQAIAVAGGFNTSAKHSQVVLYRRVSENLYEAKLVNVKKIMKSRDLTEDTHLKPGDTLFVPQNAFSKIRQFVPNPGVGVGATF
jgi:polysaccharide export outer membrane protein